MLVCTETLLLGLILAFHLRVGPALTTVYADSGTPMTMAARLALGQWLLPAVAMASVTIAAAGMFQSKRSKRLTWLAFAVGLSGVVFVGGALAAYLPLLS